MRIYESDARRILQGRTKSARRLIFLLTIYCDIYGCCKLSEQQLCEMISVRSNKTVAAAIKEITEKGLFQKVSGGIKWFGCGDPQRMNNKYYFPKKYRRTGKYFQITTIVTAFNLEQIYLCALAKLCAPEELYDVLTAKEYTEYMRYREDSGVQT